MKKIKYVINKKPKIQEPKGKAFNFKIIKREVAKIDDEVNLDKTLSKKLRITPPITKGHLKKLFNKRTINTSLWYPFVCEVKGVARKDDNGRFILLLSDDVVTKRAYPVSQMFPQIENKSIKKGTILEVTEYSCTRVDSGDIVMVIAGGTSSP